MTKEFLRKVFVIFIAVYAVFAVCFYYVANEQLSYKSSSNNIVIQDANGISAEINEKVVLTQTFQNKIDSIKEIAVVFTKYYRDIDGEVTIELLNAGQVIASSTYNNETITEQHRVYLTPEVPVTGYEDKVLVLRISSTCSEGAGPSVMVNTNDDSASFFANSEKTVGTLCFSVTGSDSIVVKQYYWIFAGLLGAILCAILYVSYNNFKKGRYNLITSAVNAFHNYQFLISQLVSRDFKSKYKRSALGVLWSFLNPLMTMTVQFLVFSTLFASGSKNYPVYLLSGVICFNFFSEVTNMCLTSITGNSNLINKVYVPRYIFPLSRTISSGINLLIALVPLMLVTLIMRIKLTFATILLFYFLICLVIFSLGVGMFLAAMMVFFRDLQFLWSVITQIWLYATPIFYTAEIIPEKYRFVIRFNPLYHFIGNLRKCLMDGVSPEISNYLYCLLFALVSFGVGSYVFKKTQDKFTLYL